MESTNKLPENYIPLHELNVCSNKLMGGAKLIGINDFAPILIGDGVIPKIWIFAKIKDNIWIPLIKESKTSHPEIFIINDKINREIGIGIADTIVIKAKMTSDKVCEVNAIDLRPIGIDIHGKENELHIANSNFSNNTVKSSGFFVGISELGSAVNPGPGTMLGITKMPRRTLS
ncbi:hypothetical protein DHD05_18870 [Arenibacter sp. N53]|uniref:hypothetical protein n=1 Tax=Arenibacter TaxID=178469 RepID=UPI000CD3CF9D|nr:MULTISPECIES: hypothetical protein [Arenibacter]MCM4153660.1 hypothetical protein [Arenibacter sp. N53]